VYLIIRNEKNGIKILTFLDDVSRDDLDSTEQLLENISLESTVDFPPVWNSGENAPSPLVAGQNPADPKMYKIFASSKDCAEAQYKMLEGLVWSTCGNWAEYRRHCPHKDK